MDLNTLALFIVGAALLYLSKSVRCHDICMRCSLQSLHFYVSVWSQEHKHREARAFDRELETFRNRKETKKRQAHDLREDMKQQVHQRQVEMYLTKETAKRKMELRAREKMLAMLLDHKGPNPTIEEARLTTRVLCEAMYCSGDTVLQQPRR
jgi:vesicle coat complex subunit